MQASARQKTCITVAVWWGGPLEADPLRLRKESGLTAEALAEQTPILVLLEAVRAVDTRQGAVVHGRAQHGANGFIRRL